MLILVIQKCIKFLQGITTNKAKLVQLAILLQLETLSHTLNCTTQYIIPYQLLYHKVHAQPSQHSWTDESCASIPIHQHNKLILSISIKILKEILMYMHAVAQPVLFLIKKHGELLIYFLKMHNFKVPLCSHTIIWVDFVVKIFFIP